MADDRSPEKPDPLIGKRLGKYRLRGRLGKGGMGIVYEAEDEVLQRRVAVKFLNPKESSATVQRFLREARAAARLQHPNVVAILEAQTSNDRAWLVMELMPGGSMQQLIANEGPLSWRLATQAIRDACRGLAAAHAAGLIHRDLKPANLLRTTEGQVKLADFGLVKMLDQSKTGSTQGVLGTPDYMSPEQAQSNTVDERSDLYSLGATWFALLTGRPPYRGETSLAVLFAHCSQPIPDPRLEQKDIPPDCVSLLHRLMAKQRRDRPGSALEVLSALERLLDQGGEPTRLMDPVIVPRWWTRRRLFVAGALGLVVLTAGLGALLLNGLPQPSEKNDRLLERVIAEMKTVNPGFDGQMREQMDGERLVGLEFNLDHVTNIEPLRQLRDLHTLRISGSETPWRNGKLIDLSPLADLPLQQLTIRHTPAEDLWPLRKLRLVQLDLTATRVRKLEALQNMPLERLSLWSTEIEDLSPLAKLPLVYLRAGTATLRNLGPIAEMKRLRELELHGAAATDLSPMANLPDLVKLDCRSMGNPPQTRLEDLTPLRTTKLKELLVDERLLTQPNKAALREIKTLKTINEKPAERLLGQ